MSISSSVSPSLLRFVSLCPLLQGGSIGVRIATVRVRIAIRVRWETDYAEPGTDIMRPGGDTGALARGVAACAFCIGLIAGASERAPESRPR